jgi:choline dehydrogenase-like flavoprotein
MSTQNRFDVIIIGTGAGCGTLAHKLAPTGKNWHRKAYDE